MNIFRSGWFAILLAVSSLWFVAGCATDDDVTNSRPWNTPKGWESGLPSALTEGR